MKIVSLIIFIILLAFAFYFIVLKDNFVEEKEFCEDNGMEYIRGFIPISDECCKVKDNYILDCYDIRYIDGELYLEDRE